jgi:retron-type reverse transcriptase
MRVRRERSTETALHLFTEKIYTIWAENKPRIASILSLNVADAFDRVSHARLAHNLRKRKISKTLIRWVKDFLKDKYTEIRIADFTLEKSKVNVSIPQGSPVSPILYLFYNADLLKICENLTLRTSPTGFVDNVNLLTYGTSTERNCRNLERIHDVCEDWARRYGSKFNPDKYELLHLTRIFKRFNTEANIKIGIKDVRPA